MNLLSSGNSDISFNHHILRTCLKIVWNSERMEVPSVTLEIQALNTTILQSSVASSPLCEKGKIHKWTKILVNAQHFLCFYFISFYFILHNKSRVWIDEEFLFIFWILDYHLSHKLRPRSHTLRNHSRHRCFVPWPFPVERPRMIWLNIIKKNL